MNPDERRLKNEELEGLVCQLQRELSVISQFAVGYGDVCELIARRARACLDAVGPCPHEAELKTLTAARDEAERQYVEQSKALWSAAAKVERLKALCVGAGITILSHQTFFDQFGENAQTALIVSTAVRLMAAGEE